MPVSRVIPLKDDIPTRRFPVLTVAIIAICVVVYFLFEQGLWDLGETGERARDRVRRDPVRDHAPRDDACARRPDTAIQSLRGPGRGLRRLTRRPGGVTIFTSMFMHGSLLHLGGNMLFLWIFGNNIEDSMGRPALRGLLPARRARGAGLQVADRHRTRPSRPSGRSGRSRRCSAATRCSIRARVWSR